jgi:hypothetical protein
VPLFMSLHQVAGLDPDQMADDSEILEATFAQFVESFIGFAEGFIATVWEAEDRSKLEKELQRLGFPFVGIHQIDLRRSHSDLAGKA